MHRKQPNDETPIDATPGSVTFKLEALETESNLSVPVLIEPSQWFPTPEALAQTVRESGGMVLLRTGLFNNPDDRYSIVAAGPLMTFRAWGSRAQFKFSDGRIETKFGNPWALLAARLSRFEIVDAEERPFPLGGGFGYWGYDLKQFLEPRLPRRAVHDQDWPDCHIGFYGSLVVFDHFLNQAWVVATGLLDDGTRTSQRAASDAAWWHSQLAASRECDDFDMTKFDSDPLPAFELCSSIDRDGFIRTVRRAQEYIAVGEIYQVNLAHRLVAACPRGGWWLYRRLAARSPAPYAAYIDGGDFEIVSSSPELFLRLNGAQATTRPIKGTRPRSSDPDEDGRLSRELQTSPKEVAELVMITDLLRNDLGRVCEYGSIRVPALARLERFAQVQHLVSTIEGRLAAGVTHLDALAACFPGGSITGAPKIRAMEIIDELESVTRGPYCGCHGYLGFNRQSQLSVTIRTAQVRDGKAWFYVGAGIVSDSDPSSEFEETLAKAQGWLAALEGSGNKTPKRLS